MEVFVSKIQKTISTSGFTLVEMSLVVLIIGLLVAGMAAGTSLIEQAKMTSVIRDLQRYTIAYNNFNSHYNEVPGDISNASAYWPTGCTTSVDPTSCNGNGNGIIDTSNEALLAWRHLVLAQDISAPITVVPYSLLGLSASLDGSFEVAQLSSSSANAQVGHIGGGVVIGGGTGGSGSSGAVTSSSSSVPASSIEGVAIAFQLSGSNGIFNFSPDLPAVLGIGKVDSLGSYTNAALGGSLTYSLDCKIDDCKPKSGNFQAASGSDISVSSTGCTIVDANNNTVYDQAGTVNVCVVGFSPTGGSSKQ